MKEIIATGKTVDEAIDKACIDLGVSKDDVNLSTEILEMPQKKLFKTIPAKVKITLNEDGFSVRDFVRGEQKNQPEKPEKSEKPEQKRKWGDNKKKPEQKNQQPQEKKPSVQPAKQVEKQVEVLEKEVDLDKIPNGAKAALSYLQSVAKCMGAEKLTYKAVEIEKGIKFLVDGEDSAILIGRRGDVMDALQYLCLLVSNRADEDYCKITFDVANYRNKRAGVLESLAKKVAFKVKKSGRNQTLEPMNPYERRIIHSTIQDIDGVKSESIGYEPNRRVIVMPEGADRRGQGQGGRRYNNNNRSRSGGGDRVDKGDRGDRTKRDYAPKPVATAPSEAQSAPVEQKPKDENASKNLYGKIEF